MTNQIMNNMQIVYFKTSLAFIDSIPTFFTWLKSQVGEFKVEGSDYASAHNDVIIISFYTDRLIFSEGESRFVDLQLVECDTKIVVSSISKI